MSRRTITAKGGPLNGRRFTVGPSATTIPSPLKSKPGSYRVTEKQATWEPASKPDLDKPGPRPVAPAPTAKPKRRAKPAAKAAASAAPEVV